MVAITREEGDTDNSSSISSIISSSKQIRDTAMGLVNSLTTTISSSNPSIHLNQITISVSMLREVKTTLIISSSSHTYKISKVPRVPTLQQC